MPGMRLDFLSNTSQRLATRKSMPLKQVEAVILYGKPEQRMKVVQKLLPNTYSLCLSKATHHIVLTLLDKCDSSIRVQMLYHLRRKIIDLCLSPVGNVIVQEMLERFPAQQKKEIAEMFVLNAEADEFRRLCEHPFGNHVAQKLIECQRSREVVEERFLPYLSPLAVHPYGQRIVAKYMDSFDEGWRIVTRELFGADGAGTVGFLFESLEDSMTVSALLRHPLVPVDIKDAICAHLCEYAADYLNPMQTTNPPLAKKDEFAQPDFGNASPIAKSVGKGQTTSHHHHAYVTVFEKGDLAQKRVLWKSLLAVPGLIEYLVSHKTALSVAVAAFKTMPETQERIWNAMMGTKTMMTTATEEEDGGTLDIVDVAQDPARTMLLRAAMEVRSDYLTESHRHRLAESALLLSQNPVSSPVLQKLVECFPEDTDATRRMLASMRGDLRQLITHNAASYLIQAMLQHSGGVTFREELVKALLDAFSDLQEMLSFAQGSRVMQKLLAYASDEAVLTVINAMLAGSAEEEQGGPNGIGENDSGEGDEREEGLGDDQGHSEMKKPISRREANRTKHYTIASRGVISYALHQHACYVVQALLRECRSRQLEPQRKLLMQELKPFVFELAVSPWSGRIVLDAMFQSGSAQLKEAMRQVVFLKAEAWLSEAPEKDKQRGGGLDPTLRQALRRGREEPSDAASSDKNDTARSCPRKRLYRTLKR